MAEPTESPFRQFLETVKDIRALVFAGGLLVAAVGSLFALPFYVATFFFGASFVLLFFAFLAKQSTTPAFEGIIIRDEARFDLTNSVNNLDKGVNEVLGVLLAEMRKTINTSEESERLAKTIVEQFQVLKEKVQFTRDTVREVLYDDNSEELDYLKYGDGPFPGSRGGVASFTDTVLLKVIADGKQGKTLDEIKEGFTQYEALFPAGVDIEKLVHSHVGSGYIGETSEDGLLRYTVTFNGWKISTWQ